MFIGNVTFSYATEIQTHRKVRGRFSALIRSVGDLQPVLDILEALCPRWLISMFLGTWLSALLRDDVM